MNIDLSKNEIELLRYVITSSIVNEQSYNIIYDLEELLYKINCAE